MTDTNTDTRVDKANGDDAVAFAPVVRVSPPAKPKAATHAESFVFDGAPLAAALRCVSHEATRYWLQGVHFQQAGQATIRMAATDGHRLLVAHLPLHRQKAPSWAAEPGIIVSAEDLKARLAMAIKAGDGSVSLTWRTGSDDLAYLADQAEVVRFGQTVIDGNFPDVGRLIDDPAPFAGTRREMEPVGFAAGYLKSVGEIAVLLTKNGEKPTIALYEGAADAPSVATFPAYPGVALWLMPCTIGELAGDTRVILSAAIKGTLAALRAHRTRSVEAAKAANGDERDALEARAAEYDARIARIVEHAGDPGALPAPKKAVNKAKSARTPKPAAPTKARTVKAKAAAAQPAAAAA